ncbi:outer membrane beta-barrel protein [Vibrio hepatarius]|uniref:outer membrane beta-barrel protein n=1 Tax=Vibrio hepatarius TaxID=171383 RepID=UPI003735C69B
MKQHTKLLIGGLGVTFASYSQANLTPKPHIGIAGIDFQSQLGMKYGRDSNVTYQTQSNDSVESDYVMVEPYLQAVGERGEDQYLLVYSGKYLQYQDQTSTVDDYSDHYFLFLPKWRFGDKHELNWFIEQTWGHEDRGTGLTEGFTNEQFRQYGINQPLSSELLNSELRYIYGRSEGRGHFNLALQVKDLSFTDTDTVEQTSADFYAYIEDQQWQEKTVTIELFDQYSKDTRFRYSSINNYRHYASSPIRDSDEHYLVFGIKSKRSGKTSVEGDIAWLHKDFKNNPQAQTFDGFNWQAALNWKPVKHSEFQLYGSRRVEDPTEVGGYILKTKYGLSWNHKWFVDRLNTKFDVGQEFEDYKSQDSDREDSSNVASFALGYDFRPSVRLEFNYQYTSKTSNHETTTFYIGENTNIPEIRQLGYNKSQFDLMLKVQI